MKTMSAIAVAAAAIAPASLVLSGPAEAATAKKPKITLVSPMRVTVGKTLTIKGRNFSRSRNGNKVVIEGAKGRLVIVKPSKASSTKLVLKVPSSVERILTPRTGAGLPTRVHLRVVTGKYDVRSGLRQSPVVVSARDGSDDSSSPSRGTGSKTTPNSSTGGGGTAIPAPCGTGNDWDGDLLDNGTELAYGLNPCSADSDGDGSTDGWEYWSAKDLNVRAVPYPGKKPYPNPLDGSDANYDFDGDSLTAATEYRIWVYTGRDFNPANPYSTLGYSDGTQKSRPTNVPAVPAFRSASLGQAYSPPAFPGAYDMPTDNDGDGTVDGPDGQYSDDERDADADGLSNFIEAAGPGRASWWSSVLGKLNVEPWPGKDPNTAYSYYGAFSLRPFADTDVADPDVDGDTLLDGEDDQDNDSVPNTTEMYNPLGTVVFAGQNRMKNAFNPCAPNIRSRTCPTYYPVN